jgi:hypothetical protein
MPEHFIGRYADIQRLKTLREAEEETIRGMHFLCRSLILTGTEDFHENRNVLRCVGLAYFVKC